MLKPQGNDVRELISLDGVWNFALATHTDIEVDAPWTQRLLPKLQIPVPASYNDIFVDPKIRDHVGWVYYQRQATTPPGWAGRRLFLRFDAATHRGRVYVNDTLVADHTGGYTPFEAEVTNLVAPGQSFRLTVAVNNELSWHTIPPGRIETLKNGRRKQHYQHDFFNYSGLARSVWMYCVPDIFITQISAVTRVSDDGKSGFVDFELVSSLPSPTTTMGNLKYGVQIIDEDDQVVAQASGTKGTMSIESVHLWQPGAAYLYQLRAQLLLPNEEEGSTKVLDTYNLSIGIRTVRVVGKQFLVNNKPFYFTGFGKHEDTPIRGKGHDPAYMVHDFQLLDWLGANSFRTAHYPYAEEVYEFADRHGIVVIDETAAVGLNLSIVAGLHGAAKTPTYSPDTISLKTRLAHEQAIRELVARDQHHPSVIMWTVANEPSAHEAGAREYFAPLVSLVRQLDPTRPVCFANEVQASRGKCLISDLFDVLCLNRYYGWYIHTGDLESAEAALEDELKGWTDKYDKPMIMSEYGADTLAGLHTVGDVPWSEEYQCQVLDMNHRVFDRVEGVVGEHVWNFADFQTSTCFVFRVDGNKKGVFTRDRRPKSAAQLLRKRWKKVD
ncbi:hypothetical protein PspLS_12173 [Pyricularia sp. CBS 133598]|nr:hypothetical protein PspLS_12173 [Pyricularia sp. CBS 133598]